jgi:hypothetical protein
MSCIYRQDNIKTVNNENIISCTSIMTFDIQVIFGIYTYVNNTNHYIIYKPRYIESITQVPTIVKVILHTRHKLLIHQKCRAPIIWLFAWQ